MTLQVDSIEAVRGIGDFVHARIAHVGFRSVSAFTRAAGLTRPTVDRVLKAEDEDDVRGYRATLETLAQHLQFREWSELVEAWKADDARRGLEPQDIVLIPFPAFAWRHVLSEADKEGLTPTEWIVGEILPPDEFERRKLASSGKPHPPGKGKGSKRRD